jgi:hypothetical protein
MVMMSKDTAMCLLADQSGRKEDLGQDHERECEHAWVT